MKRLNREMKYWIDEYEVSVVWSLFIEWEWMNEMNDSKRNLVMQVNEWKGNEWANGWMHEWMN